MKKRSRKLNPVKKAKTLITNTIDQLNGLLSELNSKNIVSIEAPNINDNIKKKRGRPKKNRDNIPQNVENKDTLQSIGKSLFLDTLKKLNRPATTNEIYEASKKLNKSIVSEHGLRGKRLYQTIQQAAFNLSKSHDIKRHQIDGKSFEYSLKEWHVQGHTYLKAQTA